MSRIPTAEEFCKNFKPNGKTWQENFHQTMIEFAKLHVKSALEAASENAVAEIEFCRNGDEYLIVNKQSILTAYPLDNIK